MKWRFVVDRLRWALLLVPVLWLGTALVAWPVNEAADMYAYVQAADAVGHEGTAYDPLPPVGPHRIALRFPFYLYPPPLAATVALTDPSPRSLFIAIALLNTMGVLAFGWGISRLAGLRGSWAPLAVALAAYLTPLSNLVPDGNVHPFILGLAVGGLALSPLGAGLALALAAAVKVTPGFALLPLLGRRRESWRGVGLALLVCLAVTVAALGVRGAAADLQIWARHVAPTLAQGQFDYVTYHGSDAAWWEARWVGRNLSLTFAPLHALAPWPADTPLPLPARIWLTGMQLAVPLAVAWLTRRRSWQVQAGYTLVAATLAAPILRASYLAVLFLLPALWWGERRGSERHGPAAAPRGAADERDPDGHQDRRGGSVHA